MAKFRAMKTPNGAIINEQYFQHDEILGRVTKGVNPFASLAQDGPKPYIKCDPNCEECKLLKRKLRE